MHPDELHSEASFRKETMELKVGDIVQLKTGGPKMTVSEVYDRGGVETVWFEQVAMKDGTIAWGAMHSADWVPEILEKLP